MKEKALIWLLLAFSAVNIWTAVRIREAVAALSALIERL